jgi:energy-coupling factor transporter ATP-binding protein EcfA2
MENLLKQIPAVIKEAAQSILGIFALIILLLSILCFVFFHDATEPTRIGIFVFIFIGFALFGFALYRKWVPESEKVQLQQKDDIGGISAPSQQVETTRSNQDSGILETSEDERKVLDVYCKWLTENYGHMDADKLYGKGEAFPLSLPEIFVPLKAYEPGVMEEKRREFEKKNEPIDIESIIAISETLLIEGQAGSGKTTLLKHLAYCLANKDGAGCKPEGMDEFLPLLIFLKDLNDFFVPEKGDGRGQNAKDILAWYLSVKLDNILSFETAEAFLKASRLAILLDGLDELPPRNRDSLVNTFSDLVIQYGGNKLVLTSRPHGIEGAAIKRFGTRHIKILSLSVEQVNQFIHRWFAYLYPGSAGIGGKNAQAMIGEIKEHPAIRQLIDNPLMLTAICILYHDEKELPGQRAELYKKFIDNMLYRRFSDSEKVHSFLKTLAFRMHVKGFRGVDGAFATDALAQVYKRQDSELEEEYEARLKQTFDDIEPKCGLLKLEAGQYVFWHLTFQEFLTAQYIVDNSRHYGEAIEKYWGNDWYNEVIELYIGYLSIENRKWANGIVEDIMVAEDKAPYKKWLLASASLVDIHKDRREEETLQETRQCMLSIIDSGPEPNILVQSGETLGWLGDTRDLKAFIGVEAGDYRLKDIGTVGIKPFEIGKYPVTNVWFEEFIKAGGYENKDCWSKEGSKWLETEKVQYPRFWDERKLKCPNSPVVGISWYEAYAFSRWLTLTRNDGYEYRLLTEEEWQAAAAGQEGREYPWGEKWDKNRCNNHEINIEKTSPVGVFKKGGTPEGISDLGGNVWEWTSSFFDDNKNTYVLRGGSWFDGALYCRCASRILFNPLNWYSSVGFRCARTVAL